MVRLTRINGSKGLSFSDEEVKVRTLQGEKEEKKKAVTAVTSLTGLQMPHTDLVLKNVKRAGMQLNQEMQIWLQLTDQL